MILFVLEGKRETRLFDTIQQLFFPKENEHIVCSFGNNIYELYRELSKMDGAGDVVALLMENYEGKPDNPFSEIERSSDFSEIFLFFDYDFQNKNLTIEEINKQLAEMFDLFDDETSFGKLYVNYPMIESIRYTKSLPDADYYRYTVTREECLNFKKMAGDFSAYSSLDFILIDSRKILTELKINSLKQNWNYLKEQNVSKANYVCHDQNTIPKKKEDITQNIIFDSQLEKYVNQDDCQVAVLNSFPLFLYEYFK